MARPLAAPALAQLLAADRGTHLRVEVQDGDGVWVDYADLMGFDWIISARTHEDVDSPLMTAEVRLAREVEGDSLAPLMTLSALNQNAASAYDPKLHPGRGVRITEAVTAPGVAPVAGDWHRVFDGYVDAVAWGDDDCVLQCSDLFSRLLKTFIEERETYGTAAGVAVETEMQAIIDRWDASPPTLVVPVSPGWMVTEWQQEHGSVLEAIRALALQIGWEVRGRWGAGDNYELTLYEPPRGNTTPDLTIGPDVYFDVSEISISDADIRNVVRVRFWNAATNLPDYREASHAGSIATFGRRFMEIEEDAASNIDTGTEAQAMADAALSDLATPNADHAIETRHLWHVQLGDLIRHQANAAHYDTDQDYAVVSIDREWANGDGTMRIVTRGQPAGAYRRWLAAGGDGTLAPIPSGVPVPTLIALTAEGSADGGQPYGLVHLRVRFGRNTDEIHVYASRAAASGQPEPLQDNRNLSAVLMRPDGDVPQAEDWETVHSIRTETGDWRRVLAFGVNRDTGQRGIDFGGEVQAVDAGTPPAAAPSGLTVTVNGTTMEVRWTNNDPAAEHLVLRNGVVIYIEAAGGPGTFDDTNLPPGPLYEYDIIAFRNGQTSAALSSGAISGGGAGNGDAPDWVDPYPQGGTAPLLGPYLEFDWSGNAAYLTSVDVEYSTGRFDPFRPLLTGQAVNPAAAVRTYTYPDGSRLANGSDLFLRLKGNPINAGVDPVLYSEVRIARVGTSTLP